MKSRGGSAASVTDTEIFEGIDLLGATEGILTEPAGGTTIACTAKLANEGKLGPDDTVVAISQRQRLQDARRAPREVLARNGRPEVEAMSEVLNELRQHGVGATLS